MSLLATLDGFFAAQAPLERGDGLVVAFSGGPDSSALLAALAGWRRGRRIELTAAHFDHGLDRGSRGRAAAAARLASRLGVRFVQTRSPVPSGRRRRECLEEAARRLRYRFLERVRLARGARYIATAHHLDDQAETVLLRLAQGSGLGGLAAIAPRRGALIRPLLGLSRRELALWLRHRALGSVDDPTNRDLAARRNLVRHRLLPRLEMETPGLTGDLARLAATAGRAAGLLERRLERVLRPRPAGEGVAIERRSLERLPVELLGPALVMMQRRAGAEHPPGRPTLRELTRQLARDGDVGCDCGAGWTIASAGRLLELRRKSPVAAPFAYTFAVPGEVELPAGNGYLRLSRRTARPWMFETSSWRAGLSLDLEAGDRITVRSRRPADRIRPFGCSYDRRLKDVFIDRKVPRSERDRLPLVCVGGRVVWVPGVTIDEHCRLNGGEKAWVAEWERR